MNGELKFVKEYPTIIKTVAADIRGWKEWEIIREFIQNALDEVGAADIRREGNILVITDKGAGFDARSFLIGKTTKDPKCNRGRFGDGMKYAIMTCMNLGYEVEIKSRGYLYKSIIKPQEFIVDRKSIYEDTLVIEQYEIPKEPGTEIRVKGYGESLFRDRFILYDKDDTLDKLYQEEFNYNLEECPPKGVTFHRCIMTPRGKLYVRDIYVAIYDDALYSYNLVEVPLSADRNIASMWNVKAEIVKLWSSCDKEELIIDLLKNMKRNEGALEAKADWDLYTVGMNILQNKDMWLRAINTVYPKSVIRGEPMFFYPSMGRQYAESAMYISKGTYKYIPLPITMLMKMQSMGVILSDLDVIKKYRIASVKTLDEKDLTKPASRHLKTLREIHDVLITLDMIDEIYNDASKIEGIVSLLKVKSMISKPSIELAEFVDIDIFGGYERSTNTIYLPPKSLNKMLELIDTYTHEIVHSFLNEVIETGSKDFVIFQSEILMRILQIIGEGKVIISKRVKW